MKKIVLLLCVALSLTGLAQPEINSWKLNVNGQKASFTMPNGPNSTYVATNDSADVLKVCYRADSVWVYSKGMTFNMGKYQNPGACSAKVYKHRFPRNPSVAATKSVSPKVGQIGLLVNGIPIYGLGNASSWNGTSNVGMGPGIWNVEVYLAEGQVLDTALGAHPQQQGAYHSHAKPRRLYNSTPSNQHSPIIGYAFDGYPVYGPYGYSSPTNSASPVARMKSGYGLRSITTRTTLPYGATLTPSQYGPPVNGTYPIGTYCEDYEWSANNGGDLDKYNGRFCVTPEYPSGTYAYFTTIDQAGTPQFPYYIGIEYYGKPDVADWPAGGQTSTTVKFPASGTSCNLPLNLEEKQRIYSFRLYPNPASDYFTIDAAEQAHLYEKVEITNMVGQVVVKADFSDGKKIQLPSGMQSGIYFVRMLGANSEVYAIEKINVQ